MSAPIRVLSAKTNGALVVRRSWGRAGPGRHCRLVLPLVAVGLMVQLGGVVADPWGMSVGGDSKPGRGPWDQQAQGSDWTQGHANDRSRSATGGHPPALIGAGSPATADVPDAAQPGWRFRGDPPKPGGLAVGGADAGPYRFRPLTERELERQGAGVDGRPPGPGQGQFRPPAKGTVWPPGEPAGFGSGPWGPSP